MESFAINPSIRASGNWKGGMVFISGHFKSRRSLGMALLVNSRLVRTQLLWEKARPIGQPVISLQTADSETARETLPDVAAGKPRAMNRCIERHGGIVWAVVRKYLSDVTEAEDLVQEIFTEIWKKAESFDPALASESTFVGMIARRRAIDHLRRKGRQPGFETLEAIKSLGHDPWAKSSVGCDPEAVKSSLSCLAPDTRELFDLFFENGFTHPEIAEKTGLPLGTIKTRLRRGLIALRGQLQRAATPNIRSAP